MYNVGIREIINVAVVVVVGVHPTLIIIVITMKILLLSSQASAYNVSNTCYFCSFRRPTRAREQRDLMRVIIIHILTYSSMHALLFVRL